MYTLLCNLVTSQLFCHMLIMCVYVRGFMCLQYQRLFLCIRVSLKMEMQWHMKLCSCRRALFEFEWVKFLLEVVAFSAWPHSLLWYSTQLGRLICLSPVLLWQILTLHWLRQTNPFLCITQKLIQVHHLNSTEGECHLVISAMIYNHFFF